MPLAEARHVRDRLRAWLLEAAYPLWCEVGTDTARGGFFEKIAQDGAPVDAPRRLRVVARQTYAYALASGWKGPWRETVEHGLTAMADYRRDDGLYAILRSPEGALLDDTPAPYEQAFVMLAFSAAQQALGRDLESQAVAVREALRARLGRPDGGFFDGLPHAGPLRANPHMHLFEAALAWVVAGQDSGWREMAAGIADIALSRMIDPTTGALCELFDTGWRALPQADVEPGHQFEWGWLLIRFAALFDRPQARAAGLRLIELAEARGVDPVRGVAFNALDAALQPRDTSARLWPQTERIKAGAAAALATGDDRFWTLAARAGEGLLEYLDTPVAGLWLDRMEEGGALVDEPAPASSFYHIAGAIADLDRALVLRAP